MEENVVLIEAQTTLMLCYRKIKVSAELGGGIKTDTDIDDTFSKTCLIELVSLP